MSRAKKLIQRVEEKGALIFNLNTGEKVFYNKELGPIDALIRQVMLKDNKDINDEKLRAEYKKKVVISEPKRMASIGNWAVSIKA